MTSPSTYIPETEFDIFMQWLEANYPGSSPSLHRRITNPRYIEWVEQGKPGYTPPKYSQDWWSQQQGVFKPTVFDIPTTPQPETTAPVATSEVAQTVEASRPTAQPETIEVSGQTYIVNRLPSGEIIDYTLVPQPYQPDKTGQAVQNWIAMQQLQMQQQQLADERAARLSPQEQERMEILRTRQTLAQNYEDFRRRMLTELTQPQDWITRWQVEHLPAQLPEQFMPKLGLDVGAIDERIKQLTDNINAIEQERINNPYMSSRAVDAQIAEYSEELARLTQVKLEVEGEVATGRDIPQMSFQALTRDIPAPPAPDWLARIVPGLQSGQPINKAQIPTLTGQQLTPLSASQRAALSGYADWAGGRSLADILEARAIQQPQDITQIPRTRWTPASQR